MLEWLSDKRQWMQAAIVAVPQSNIKCENGTVGRVRVRTMKVNPSGTGKGMQETMVALTNSSPKC